MKHKWSPASANAMSTTINLHISLIIKQYQTFHAEPCKHTNILEIFCNNIVWNWLAFEVRGKFMEVGRRYSLAQSGGRACLPASHHSNIYVTYFPDITTHTTSSSCHQSRQKLRLTLASHDSAYLGWRRRVAPYRQRHPRICEWGRHASLWRVCCHTWKKLSSIVTNLSGNEPLQWFYNCSDVLC